MAHDGFPYADNVPGNFAYTGAAPKPDPRDAEIARLRQVAILEGMERKSALAIAREAVAKAGLAAELEDEIARLRAVLEDFAAETEQEFMGEGGWQTRPTRHALKARAALPSRKPD